MFMQPASWRNSLYLLVWATNLTNLQSQLALQSAMLRTIEGESACYEFWFGLVFMLKDQ